MSLKYLPIRKIPKMFEKLKLGFRQHITGKILDFVEYFDKQRIKSKVKKIFYALHCLKPYIFVFHQVISH